MPTEDKPNTETLKNKKEWYIDQDGKTVYYDVAKDTESGWWLRLNTKNEHKTSN